MSISVTIRGCVGKNHSIDLGKEIMLSELIEMAGGLGEGEFRPTGKVTIRSKDESGKSFQRLQIDVVNDPESLREKVMDNDFVNVQFDVSYLE